MLLKNYEVLWNEAYYTVGISDNRGLKGKIILKTDSTELEAEPGVRDNDIFQSGISFINPVLIPGKKISICNEPQPLRFRRIASDSPWERQPLPIFSLNGPLQALTEASCR